MLEYVNKNAKMNYSMSKVKVVHAFSLAPVCIECLNAFEYKNGNSHFCFKTSVTREEKIIGSGGYYYKIFLFLESRHISLICWNEHIKTFCGKFYVIWLIDNLSI